MPSSIKGSGGVNNTITQVSVRIGAAWQTVSGAFVRVGSDWKRWLSIVPSIIGMLKSNADAAITEQALVPSGTASNTTNSTVNQQVISQNPAGNTVVDPGSTVTYTYYQYVPPFFPPSFGPFFPPVFGPFFPPPFPWAHGSEEQPYD